MRLPGKSFRNIFTRPSDPFEIFKGGTNPFDPLGAEEKASKKIFGDQDRIDEKKRQAAQRRQTLLTGDETDGAKRNTLGA